MNEKANDKLTKIKKALENNYWLQPVILVALVFALIFAVQGITSSAKAAKIEKEANAGKPCPHCTTAVYGDVISLIESGKDTYVLITQETCASCEKAYPIIEKFISSYKDDFIFYTIDVEKNEDKYNDETITDETFFSFGKLVDVGVTTSGYKTFYEAETDEYVYQTPTIVHFQNKVASEALVGIADYESLAEFMGVND